MDKEFINSIAHPLRGSSRQPELPLPTSEPVLAAPEPNPATAVYPPPAIKKPVLDVSPGASSRFQALREALFAEGLPDLRAIGRRGEEKGMDLPADVDTTSVELPRAPADPPPGFPEVPPQNACSKNPPRFSSNRLERGDPLDGIQILPSQPGQYRRKS